MSSISFSTVLPALCALRDNVQIILNPGVAFQDLSLVANSTLPLDITNLGRNPKLLGKTTIRWIVLRWNEKNGRLSGVPVIDLKNSVSTTICFVIWHLYKYIEKLLFGSPYMCHITKLVSVKHFPRISAQRSIFKGR